MTFIPAFRIDDFYSHAREGRDIRIIRFTAAITKFLLTRPRGA